MHVNVCAKSACVKDRRTITVTCRLTSSRRNNDASGEEEEAAVVLVGW